MTGIQISSTEERILSGDGTSGPDACELTESNFNTLNLWEKRLLC